MSGTLFSTYSVLLTPICSAVALLLCLAARPVADKLGLVDIPGGRKAHRRPTPLVGGLALLLGFYPWVAIWATLNSQPIALALLPITACSAALTLLGVADDRRHLPASLRLLICFVLISLTLWQTPLLVLKAISWDYDRGAVSLTRGGLIFSTITIVTLIQAANLADGKNGLLIGMCLSWLYFLGIALPDNLTPVTLSLSAVLAVLLAFNLSGKLFLGDGGSYGLATFIGFLALLAADAPRDRISSDQIALIFLLPVIDLVRLMISRLARGQSPFTGDRDHLHHHLLASFGWPGGLAAYLMMVVLPSLVAAGAPRNTLAIIALTIVLYFAVIAYARIVAERKGAKDG